MDFELSDEQRLLRDTIRSFVDAEIRPVARDWEESGRYPEEIVATMREMGLFGMLVPEQYGGMAADMVSLAVVFEEISRGWMGIAGIIGSHSLSCWMIARFGTEEQKSAHLQALASGERRTGIGLTEPGAGSDLQGIATTARRRGDHYVVTGRKTWITNARHADPLPVLVKTDPSARPVHKGMSVLLVDPASAGFEVLRDLPKLGYGGPETCELVLDEVRVQAARLLTYWAAARADAGRRADLESGLAKVYASEVAYECAFTAMQVHGGYGYSKEFTVERLYRDAPLMVIGEGTNDILRTVIAESLIS